MKRTISLALVTPMAFAATAFAQSPAVPVTPDNFAHAETDISRGADCKQVIVGAYGRQWGVRNMPKEHVAELEKARAKLVEGRRIRARSIAVNSGEMDEGLITGIIDIQDAIEGIDRAIKDERTTSRGRK